MAKVAQLSARHEAEASWTATQAYVLAVACLLLGVALGYLFRGSASQAAAPSASENAGFHQGLGDGMSGMPTPEQLKAMLDRAAAPLLEAINKDPNDVTSLVKLGNIYYDGKQYPDAIKYYGQALKVQPDNADVHTDLGTSYWYTGDADRAINEFRQSLKIRPNHPETLFNLGVVEWQGMNDPRAAVKDWELLLKANPEYPQRQQIEQFIAKAKEHAAKS